MAVTYNDLHATVYLRSVLLISHFTAEIHHSDLLEQISDKLHEERTVK